MRKRHLYVAISSQSKLARKKPHHHIGVLTMNDRTKS